MTAKTAVEFENERVRVTRVKQSGSGKVAAASRNDRLIVYVQDSEIKRRESGREEKLKRRTGDVLWRGRSQHEIESTKDGPHEVLIIELKS